MISIARTLLKPALLIGAQILFQPFASQNGITMGQRKAAEETPLFREYRGVELGMAADDARRKLGGPKDKGDEQDFFVINDKETAQIVYDKAHKVVTISVDYVTGAADVPTPKKVFGSDIPVKPDGSMYRMVRYTKAGLWVSYNRTPGDSPLISITIQKIE